MGEAEADGTIPNHIQLDGSDVEWDETELVQERPTIDQWTTAMPADAQRGGLDQTTPEGQMVGFFAGLDGSRSRARIAAWVCLALFLGPVLVSLLVDLF